MVLRPLGAGMEALCLRRAQKPRLALWESVHGHIEPGESPVDAAVRELREETSFPAERLYNLSRVDSYYSHRRDVVELIPSFCAIVKAGAEPTLCVEHDAAQWLAPAAASALFAWPREVRALEDAMKLVGRGDTGGQEDLLRVR
ncbi:MAG: NUDIX domain-containing protein [Gemmatimonadales bacterium]